MNVQCTFIFAHTLHTARASAHTHTRHTCARTKRRPAAGVPRDRRQRHWHARVAPPGGLAAASAKRLLLQKTASRRPEVRDL
eukprot:357431-Chlamydomonas_euryale.AAC.2